VWSAPFQPSSFLVDSLPLERQRASLAVGVRPQHCHGMPVNTANPLSRKERNLLLRQHQAARRRKCQQELLLLQKQAQQFFELHLRHLQKLNEANNRINLRRLGSLKYKIFKQLEAPLSTFG